MTSPARLPTDRALARDRKRRHRERVRAGRRIVPVEVDLALIEALEGIAVWPSRAIVEALAFRAIMAAIGGVSGGGAGAGAGGFGALVAGLLPQPRAAGGPISSGRPYIVGERGPEFFVPNVAGQIVPNGGGGGQGMAPTIIINDQRGKGAPPVETSVDFRGVVTATIWAEVGSMARDGSLGMMTGNRRKGIARG